MYSGFSRYNVQPTQGGLLSDVITAIDHRNLRPGEQVPIGQLSYSSEIVKAKQIAFGYECRPWDQTLLLQNPYSARKLRKHLWTTNPGPIRGLECYKIRSDDGLRGEADSKARKVGSCLRLTILNVWLVSSNFYDIAGTYRKARRKTESRLSRDIAACGKSRSPRACAIRSRGVSSLSPNCLSVDSYIGRC